MRLALRLGDRIPGFVNTPRYDLNSTSLMVDHLLAVNHRLLSAALQQLASELAHERQRRGCLEQELAHLGDRCPRTSTSSTMTPRTPGPAADELSRPVQEAKHGETR